MGGAAALLPERGRHPRPDPAGDAAAAAGAAGAGAAGLLADRDRPAVHPLPGGRLGDRAGARGGGHGLRGASVLLPTGRAFDALEVPESAGFLALARMERMDLTLGPVTCTPDRRMLFFVLPGAAAKISELVRALGWNAEAIDLTGRGEGHYIAAPPTRVGGRGAVQWARKPTTVNRWLPDVDELVSPLAYACAREAADARARAS
ncbi:bifunctional DNA primase/polymerase [Streptomyces nanshensis]|uniref:bifunctional DNA primase/polymerase n=1 Tax=Streptomyces nanshensis TaxID=518642 RepID=UPI0009A10091|nr:bifunctional DNA primase/polymerase [Streptomyces nanshensis]